MPTKSAADPLSIPSAARWQLWAWRLALTTVLYNFAEGAVALWLGHASDSLGLVSFGIEGVAESLSGIVVLWRFAPSLRPHTAERGLERERRAVLLIGLSFLVLAAVIAMESLGQLLGRAAVHLHGGSFVLAAASVVIKPALFAFKRRVGQQLGSRAILADAVQTLACAALSAALLLSLLLQQLWGIHQADALLALLISAVLVREGLHTLRHRHILCC
jgi:divalent metal cation (Fe/Co/Zn/Cd) transporter